MNVSVKGMVNTDALLRIASAAADEGNFELAMKCYESGAALGDGLCFHALGYMHDVGEGVTVDKGHAMRLYRRAWRLNCHAAAANIAALYRDQGKMRTMFRWYKRVALAGDGSAHLEMAKCYLNAKGVRKDLQAALRCLSVAKASEYITEVERDEADALLATLRPSAI